MEQHRRNDIKWPPNFLGMTIYTEWFVGLHARRYFVQTSHKLDIYLMYGTAPTDEIKKWQPKLARIVQMVILAKKIIRYRLVNAISCQASYFV